MSLARSDDLAEAFERLEIVYGVHDSIQIERDILVHDDVPETRQALQRAHEVRRSDARPAESRS